MTVPRHDDAQALRRLLDALAESAAQQSDAEARAEAREAGEDPGTVASEMRALAHEAVKSARQQKLKAARASYELMAAGFEVEATTLPPDPADRRRLLQETLRRRPELRVTLAARDLERVPDEDVESLLRQLAALGALADLTDGRE